MVPTAGGIALRRFVPDTTDRSRFPPMIRLEALLLGVSLGTADITSDGAAGQIREISVRRGWPRATVAARFLSELERIAPLASWTRLVWEVTSDDPGGRALAEGRGFHAIGPGAPLQKWLSAA